MAKNRPNSRRAKGNGEGTFIALEGIKDSEGNWISVSKWRHQFFITLDDGTRKRKSVIGTSKTICNQQRIEIEKEIATNTYANKNSIETQEWFEKWFGDYKENKLESETINNYKNIAKNHIYPALGKTPLQKLSPNMLQILLNDKSSKYSNSLIKKIFIIFKGALKQAKKEGLIKRIITEDIEIPKVVNGERNTPNWQSLKNVANKAKEHPLFIAYLLTVGVGIRRSELLGLKKSKVNFDNNTITIKSVVVRNKGKVKLKLNPKRDASERTLPVPKIIMDMLKEYINNNSKDSELVFSTRNGTPIQPDNFSRLFRSWRKAAGEDFTFHAIRHAFATDMIDTGESIKTVQGLTGHADAKTLIKDYAHIVDSSKKKAISRRNTKIKKMLQDMPKKDE